MIFILRYFDIWGFCTEFQTTKNSNKYYLVIFVIHILIDFIASWSIVTFLKRPTEDTLGHVNDVIKLGSILFVCILSITESYVKRNNQRTFWDIFQEIEQSYRSKQSFQLKSYLKKFAFFIIGSITSSLYLLLYSYYNSSIFTQYPIFWLNFEMVTKVYQNRVLYYLFYLELVENELRMIERIAEDAAQGSNLTMNNNNGNGKNGKIQTHEDNLKRICEYYQLTRKLSEELNLAFGWSNAATVLFSFGLILTDLNWVYWIWYEYKFKIMNLIGLLIS